MAAKPRYEVANVYGDCWVIGKPDSRGLAAHLIEANAYLIAAALNAVEDARRAERAAPTPETQLMAAKRYRADEPYPWDYRVTDLLEGRYVATCTIEGMAEVIAAALNAAEDAGRWKAALEGLVDFITDIRASGDCGYFEINAQPGERFFRAAVEALEPKEATT